MRLVTLLPLALLVSPEIASACSVCTGGQTDEVRYAFIWTTGFMSVLPLGLVGGLVWFLRRRVREIEARQARPELQPVPIGPGLRRSSSSR